MAIMDVGRSAACDAFRVLLVEENEVARRGLHEMLRSLCDDTTTPLVSDICVAGSALGALALMAEFEPSLLMLPSDIGASAIDSLLNAAMGCAVVLLLRSAEPGHLAAAYDTPADGFIMEQEVTEERLATALRQIGRGEMPMPSALARHMLNDASTRSVRARQPLLTPREGQVLQLLAGGLSNKQIARALSISAHGAKRHVANVLMKLNCPNRTMAVARALNEDLLGARAEGACTAPSAPVTF
jgi:DNA-binding NarL/FixJ family response regulator